MSPCEAPSTEQVSRSCHPETAGRNRQISIRALFSKMPYVATRPSDSVALMRSVNFDPAPPLDADLGRRVALAIDGKTKPLGSLGELERLAKALAMAQGVENPCVEKAEALVFAGDHGAATSGISAYPSEVTAQMVLNFLGGNAAINVFCRSNDLDFRVVDAGVASPLAPHSSLIDQKIALGTKNYLERPAMDLTQAEQAIHRGILVARQSQHRECRVLLLGEMGIGNSSSAALITHCVTRASLEECVGRGTGVDDNGLRRKTALLFEALARGGVPQDPWAILCEYGGFEIAMMAGCMIGAAQARQIAVVDGYIASAAALLACALVPSVRPYLVFAHHSQERGHRHSLKHLDAHPLLDLQMRLGEGTGAALAYPLLRCAARFLNEMASFESAGVSTRRGS